MDDASLYDALTTHIRCVVCSTITTRSLQCFNAHPHCVECQRRMKLHRFQRTVSCSVCRSRRGWTSTRAMVDIATHFNLQVPCEDCNINFPIQSIDSHRASCSNKLFKCPLDCECEIRGGDLVDHMKTLHKRVIRVMDADQCLHCILQVGEISRLCYIVVHERLVSLRINMRLCRSEGFSMEVFCGVFGNIGSESHMQVRVTLFDLMSSDTLQQTHTIEVIDDDGQLMGMPSLLCFDNFTHDALADPFNYVECPWTAREFRAHCPSVTDEDEFESNRIIAVTFQFMHHILDCKLSSNN